nr:DUF6348 family protein [Clostridium tetanomorphum]
MNIQGEILNGSLVLNDYNIIIKTQIGNRKQHPNVIVLQLDFILWNKDIFNEGIYESLVGLAEGSDIESAIKNGVNSFVTGALIPIINSFDDIHNPELDFKKEYDGINRLWHPKVGPLQAQGYFDANNTDENRIFDILKNDIKEKITNKRMYWIKVYIARQTDGCILSQCTINNEPFYSAQNKIEEYARTWKVTGQFKAEKQYIILRQCDKTWNL